MVKRIILSPDGLVVSKPGVDVTTLGPEDVEDLHFHSSWARIEAVHQIGTFAVTYRFNQPGFPGSPTPGIDNGAVIEFPTLAYIPCVTYRRRNSLTGANLYADEWFKLDTGGTDDPYRSPYSIIPFVDKFFMYRIKVSGQNVNDGAPSNEWDQRYLVGAEDGIQYFYQYIVWKIPANQTVTV